MAKRSKLEIIGDMLTVIQEKRGRIKPTHLMYKANLSHAQLTGYLEELVQKEMIEEVQTPQDTKYIIITDKGCKFVQKIQEMKQFEKSFGFE